MIRVWPGPWYLSAPFHNAACTRSVQAVSPETEQVRGTLEYLACGLGAEV